MGHNLSDVRSFASKSWVSIGVRPPPIVQRSGICHNVLCRVIVYSDSSLEFALGETQVLALRSH